jgi:hypothetical protein
MDEIPAQISFGGPVTRTQWNQMVEVASLLDNFLPAEMKTRDEDWNPYIASDGTLTLQDPQAHGGQFECLEYLLQEQGIPYDRHSDGCDEYDAEETSWRPGMDHTLIATSTTDGDLVVKASKLIEWLSKGMTLSDVLADEPTNDTVGLWLHGLRTTDPVPKFEFIEEEEEE